MAEMIPMSTPMADGHRNMAMGDSDEEYDLQSAQSEISNESDFDEDEEIEFLALELVHHLPPEKAEKLMKNMRAKEKAVQDLLDRNRKLLDSCKSLDDENQTLTERLKGAEERPLVPAPAGVLPIPKEADVDLSVFQKMEMGKEAKIRALAQENQQLARMTQHVQAQNQRLNEELAHAHKELKKMATGRTPPPPAPAPAPAPRAKTPLDQQVLDEEERIYQELQGSDTRNSAVRLLEQRQAESRHRVQAALSALLKEDLLRIERWGSDASAMMLAIDGAEGQVKHGAKDASSKAPKKGKTGAGAAPSGSSTAQPLGSERITEISAQIVDDFDSMRRHVEDLQKVQLSLEQTSRGVQDGAGDTVELLDLDCGLDEAEQEVEWIREHNASWVERSQGISLEPTVAMLSRTQEAVKELLENAPPGLIPPNVQGCLNESSVQMEQLCTQLSEQALVVSQLQGESVSFGRRVRALQAAHKKHRIELRRRLAQELQRSAAAFEGPLERARDGLRLQGEAISQARSRVSAALEDLAAAARRCAASSDSAAVSSGGGSSGGDAGHLDATVRDVLREVRALARELAVSLEEGGKAMEGRAEQLLSAFLGDSPPSAATEGGRTMGSSSAASRTAATGATDGGGCMEAKKKKSKKKGGKEAATSASGPGSVAACADAADEPTRTTAACFPDTGSGEKEVAAGDDEEACLRAEMRKAFSEGEPKRTKPSSGKNVLSGQELLQQLQSLRSEEKALEARMAERMSARGAPPPRPAVPEDVRADLDEADDSSLPGPVPKAKARRKKMFV